MVMRIFAVNGNALSGKDSFTEKVKVEMETRGHKVATISTIDPVRGFYRSMGWDGNKFKDEHRKNLNSLKKIWIDACNGPLLWTTKQCATFNTKGYSIVFIMVREFEEMEQMLKFGDGAIRVIRDGLAIPPVEQEFIDSHPKDYIYDFTIKNPTTSDPALPDLTHAAVAFADMVTWDGNPHKRSNWVWQSTWVWEPEPRIFVPSTSSVQQYNL